MDPTTALGVAAAAVQFAEQAIKISDCLYQYFKSVKNAPAKSRELRQEALLLSDVLETLTDLFSDQNKLTILPNATKYADMLTEFKETMAEMAKKVELKKGKLSFKRLTWPFNEKENERYLAKMERFKTSFQLAQQALQSYQHPHFVLTCQFKVG
jgi:Fungal N-terminal domain of STAND proteins